MPTRRARKSIDQWTELVERFDSSEDSMEEFCQRENLATSTFQRWRSTIHRSKIINNGSPAPGFTHITTSPSAQNAATPAVTLQIGSLITVTINTAESL